MVSPFKIFYAPFATIWQLWAYFSNRSHFQRKYWSRWIFLCVAYLGDALVSLRLPVLPDAVMRLKSYLPIKEERLWKLLARGLGSELML